MTETLNIIETPKLNCYFQMVDFSNEKVVLKYACNKDFAIPGDKWIDVDITPAVQSVRNTLITLIDKTLTEYERELLKSRAKSLI